jgi:uncharacterized protein
VSASSPFVVPISDLVSEPGARRAVDLDVVVDWSVGPTTVGPGLEAALTLENASGTIVVRGTAATRLALGCHRCLTEWTEDLEVAVTEALGLEGDEDGYDVDVDGADLEPVLRDAILLEVPMRPLCREDCLGLCATCGADLNTGACPGHDDEEASPFAVLRDLLEP